MDTTIEHVIDLDAEPFVPDGWKVEEHQKGGQFKWDASKVALYLSKKQQGGSFIEGNKLREGLKRKRVYNANLLDYLLANPDLIPEGWKGKAVFFWGTIYRNSDGYLCVRYLYWNDDRWDWTTTGSATTGTISTPLRSLRVEYLDLLFRTRREERAGYFLCKMRLQVTIPTVIKSTGVSYLTGAGTSRRISVFRHINSI